MLLSAIVFSFGLVAVFANSTLPEISMATAISVDLHPFRGLYLRTKQGIA